MGVLVHWRRFTGRCTMRRIRFHNVRKHLWMWGFRSVLAGINHSVWNGGSENVKQVKESPRNMRKRWQSMPSLWCGSTSLVSQPLLAYKIKCVLHRSSIMSTGISVCVRRWYFGTLGLPYGCAVYGYDLSCTNAQPQKHWEELGM